jgi:hypothetical protein
MAIVKLLGYFFDTLLGYIDEWNGGVLEENGSLIGLDSNFNSSRRQIGNAL